MDVDVNTSPIVNDVKIIDGGMSGLALETPLVLNQTHGDGWSLYHADTFEGITGIPDNTIGLSVFSPPFASLYVYSDSVRDAGNCVDMAQFIDHFNYLTPQLLRVTMPSRICAVHCMPIPTSKARDGHVGLQDFRGWLCKSFVDAGWIYHAEVGIWKDPVTQMQRTHSLRLLHKQLRKDSCMSGMGLADYVVFFRKPGENSKEDRVGHTADEFPVAQWQQWASPYWLDIDPSDTLQHRSARAHEDERHICPLQLEVIRRCEVLYSNPGDIVLSPFAGIGSEGFVSLGGTTKAGLSVPGGPRRFVGFELKREYYEQACNNLQIARSTQEKLPGVE